MVDIKINGIEQLNASLTQKQKAISEGASEGVIQATLQIHSAVKESIARGINAPVAVDTGRFLNSVDFEALGENKAVVYTDIEYAKYIEYGTSRMKARPHFGNTSKKEAPKVKDIVNLQVSKK